jgi:hypothetical protein
MSARQLLIGCVFALGSIGAASAVEVDTQDLASTQHAVDVMTAHEGNGSDAPATPACRTGCNSDESAPGTAEHGATGVNAHPHNSSHRSLGWQSLLPGSIQ